MWRQIFCFHTNKNLQIRRRESMVKMQGITKHFGAVTALKEASLEVGQGEIMALLGANGSGKSTLIKVLSGLVRPDKGTVSMAGEGVRIHSAIDSRALGIATAYQDLSLIPAMSVIDNIVMGLEPTKFMGLIDQVKTKEIALKFMKELKIECDPNTLVQSLMPSTQSMVEIAKALASNPKLLILDEATASLHSDEVDTLFELLKRLKKEGLSVITVTHRMGEIYRICDRCTILRSGEMVATGKVKDMELDEVVYHMTGKYPEAAESNSITKVNKEDEEEVIHVKALSVFPKVNKASVVGYKGEIIGIGGLDGQGQSEFLRAILADIPLDSGTITYKGRAVNYKQPADAIKDEMGFISGDRARESVFPIRSVAENIYVGASAKGRLFSVITPQNIKKFAKNAIDTYGIVAGSPEHQAASLSGGNQQKLVVGRWLALSPSLLLLDDPTKGVDIKARQEIHKILKECVNNGMCVIYISSDNEELLEISDRIYVFYEGRISAELSGDERTEEHLVDAMLAIKEVRK